MVKARLSTPAPSPPFDANALRKEEVDTLRQHKAQHEQSTTASSFGHTGYFASSLNASSTKSNDPWIIDSGASDNMTGLSFMFSSYNLC